MALSTVGFLLLFIFIAVPILGLDQGKIIPNNLLSLPVEIDGTVINAKITLDSTWHWIHATADTTKTCRQVCNSPETCWSQCSIEGISNDQWSKTYGITVDYDALTIRYVTGTNVGSRTYLLDAQGQKYIGLNMLSRELSFDADMSQAGCGLNGAVYFVEMQLDGGPNLNKGAPASVGLGYCDAQCPSTNFINGRASGVPGFYPFGACCAEFDIWQANNQATQMTTHICNSAGLYQCNDDINCGRNGNRYKGHCDMDGKGINPYKSDKLIYGSGSKFKIDTSKPFTVKTQFITDDGLQTGNLVQIKRIYVQDGKSVNGGSINSQTFNQNSVKIGINSSENMKSMGEAFKRKMVLSFSLWDDYGSHMQWLDGGDNGPCPADSGNPDIMRKQVPNSKVIYSKIKVTKLSKIELKDE